MRAYRESYAEPGRRRGLSQDELLRRMAEVDDSYGRRFSHATVTRWEAGTTRPNADRLRVFGKALNLSATEVEGLITLAGLVPDAQDHRSQDGAAESTSGPIDPASSGRNFTTAPTGAGASRTEHRASLLSDGVLRFLAFRLFIPTIYVAAAGYALNAFGWNHAWMPLAYVMTTTLLVLIQAFVWPARSEGLRDFYWASMFILVTFPALRFAPLGLDHYGFYRMGDQIGAHMPYMLMLLVGVAMSGLSALAFQLLWKWQSSSPRAERSALTRSIWASVPPTLICYATVVVLSGETVWIQATVAMPILVGALIAMLVIRDPYTNPDPGQSRFLLQAAFLIVLVASTLGAVIIVMVYGAPDPPMALPDHNLLGSWTIDFSQLGYTNEQVLQRLDSGYMWHSMCLYMYMVAVVAGSMLVALYRLAGRTGNGPDAVHAVPAGESLATNAQAGSQERWSLLPHAAVPITPKR